MKKGILFLMLSFYFSTSAQFKQIVQIQNDTILDYTIPLKRNPFKDRFLLTGKFMPIQEGSKTKLAKVLTNDGWGLIDEKGKTILPNQYFNISNFQNGLADVTLLIPRKNNKSRSDRCYAVINSQGKMVTPKCFLKNDYSVLNDHDGFGRLFVRNTSKLSDGLLKVRIDKLTSIYNKRGEQVIPAEYSEITFSGKYFLAQKEIPERHFVIYNLNGDKIRTVKSANVYIIGDLMIIRNNWREYVENLITGKKYFEGQYNTISPLNSDDADDKKDIILFATNYVDGKCGKIISTFYINKDYQVIQNQTFSKTINRFGKSTILAENPENKNVAILDFKGNILQTFTKEEFDTYQELNSFAYKDSENLQKKLIKYHSLWSRYDYRDYDIRNSGIYIFWKIKNDDKNETILILKKNGKIVNRITNNISYYAPFSKNKFLLGFIGSSAVITDFEGNILKTAKPEQSFDIFMDQLLIEENNIKYFADQSFNPIYGEKIFRIEKIGKTNNYIMSLSEKTVIHNAKGKILQSIDDSLLDYSNYFNGSTKNYLTLITKKSYTILSTKTWKPIFQVKFKSRIDGQMEGGIFVHGENNGNDFTNTYIDPYMNVVKISYDLF